MNVNQKGDIGLSKVVSDLTERGLQVFLPFSGSCAVDLVVANQTMSLKRIQIKYRNIERDRIIIKQSSVVNGKRVPIDHSLIDGWAVYCPDTKTVYYIPMTDVDISAKEFSFRLTETKQPQPSTVMGDKFLDPYRFW